MKTFIFAFLWLGTPLTCYAAMSQADCPPNTIWNSGTNGCYEDPTGSAAQARKREAGRRAREEQERAEQQQHNKVMEDLLKGHSKQESSQPVIIINPAPAIDNR
jgi:hypothetical protein